MSIIDFSSKFENYDTSKTTQEKAIEFYNSNEESLNLHIGDSVKINLPTNCNQSLIELFKDKVFQIINVDMDFDIENPLSYVLNTGIDMKLFKDKHLIKVII